MNENRDEFWKDLLGENPFEEKKDPQGEKDSPDGVMPGFTIEYVNTEGEVLGTSEKLGGEIEKRADTRPLPQTPADKPAAQQQKPEAVKPVQPTPEAKPAPKPVPEKKPVQPAPEAKPAEKPVQQEKRTVRQPTQRPAAPQIPADSTGVSLSEGRNSGTEPSQLNDGAGEARRPSKQKRSKADDFEVDFDFDGEYEDVNEKAVRRGRSKRTGCLSGVLFFIFILCISIVLACLGWKAATDVRALGKEKEPVTVTVPKEIFTEEKRETENSDGEKETKTVSVADMDYIADMLYDNGLIQYKWLFRLFARFSTAEEKVRPGVYVLSKDYDYRALVSGMNPSAGERVEVDITIPEGYTLYQIVQLLDSEGVCDADEMWEALANHDFEYAFLDKSTLGEKLRLEGYLFPDTYTVYLGDNPARVINKFLSNFNRKWTDEMQIKADALGYTQYEILTVASMIEKEAGGDADRPLIASVIYNRLRDGGAGTYGLLQIDATIYYAIAGTSDEFSTDYESPYNTYNYAGLTPGPIANPGLASINAALDPASTDYYYYALAKDRLHRFFATFEEQQAFVHSDEYGG